mgnify:CR=1 FL=1
MKTPTDLYNYETKRIERYKKEFNDILASIDIDKATYDKLTKLFDWYGHARAIKSKAYQEMKNEK